MLDLCRDNLGKKVLKNKRINKTLETKILGSFNQKNKNTLIQIKIFSFFSNFRFIMNTMKPCSQIGRKMVEMIFSKQKILIQMGSKLKTVNHGEVLIQLPKSQLALQQHGFFHGGIITTLADTAAGLSAFSLLQDERHSIITVQLKINFMRPADGDSIYSIGKVLKENKSLMVATAEVFTNQKLCAYMVQTVKRIIPEDNPTIKIV